MNADDVTWRLAQLASLPFQQRYVIEGTADEYVLDTELLENVDGLKYLIRRPENRSAFTAEQHTMLEDLFAYIEIHSGEALSGSSREEQAARIRESEVWKGLRARAASALEAFGHSADLTVEEIDRMSDGA